MRQFSAMTEGITKGIIAHLRDNNLSTQLPGSKGILTWSEPQWELLESTDRFTKAVEVVLEGEREEEREAAMNWATVQKQLFLGSWTMGCGT